MIVLQNKKEKEDARQNLFTVIIKMMHFRRLKYRKRKCFDGNKNKQLLFI